MVVHESREGEAAEAPEEYLTAELQTLDCHELLAISMRAG